MNMEKSLDKKRLLEDKFKQYDVNMVSKYYNRQHLVNHIESSYAEFLEHYLAQFFKQNEKTLMLSQPDKKRGVIVDYYLNLGRYSLELTHYKGPDRTKKAVDSAVAMKYNLTRELNLNLQMHLSSKVRDSEEEEEIITRKKVKYQIGKLPLLINSRYDPYAENSLITPYHFIVNGSCRLLYHLLEPNNAIKIIKGDKNSVNIRYSKDSIYNRQSVNANITEHNVTVSFPNLSATQFNLFSLLRLLEVPITQVLDIKSKENDSLQIFNLAYEPYTKPLNELYMEYLSTFKVNFSKQDSDSVLKEKVESHIQQNLFHFNLSIEYSNWKELKKDQLLDILKELMYYKNDPENIPYIDSLAHKKLFSLKNHFSRVFQQSFKQILSKGKVIILRDLGLIKRTKSLTHIVRSDVIKKSFRKYLTQGTSSSITVPQSEHLSYTNMTSVTSAQRKIVSSLNKTLTHEKYRCVNPSKSGRICCVQTPHSRSVGLVEYLALGAITSTEVDFSVVSSLLSKVDSSKENSTGSLYVNDKFIGYVYEDLKKIHEKMLKLKRKYPIGVVLKDSNLYINLSEGRILKPFYTVSKEELGIFKLTHEQFLKTDLKELVYKGYVTYLDFQEELSIPIAPTIGEITKETQVMHINPAAYLSYSGSGLPLVSTNAAHRASLALRLIDQSIGGKLTKPLFKFNELKVEYLVNSNPSILRTSFDESLREDVGQNLIIAFMHGQNEEDSVVINKSAVQRGLLNSVMWKRVIKEVKKDDCNRFNYQISDKVDTPVVNLESDHLPRVGSLVNEDLIMMVDEGNMNRPTKVFSPHTQYYINEISVDTPVEDAPIVEFKFSKLRKVGEGDKIGTRYGLKGIISKPRSQLDLVIPENGVHPTLMISNHVINSRMIIGPLLELHLTKAAVLEGTPKVAPVFAEESTVSNLVNEARQVLRAHNYDEEGYELLFDVSTNSVKRISMGPSKTQLLEHYARDKFYTRAHKGGINALTRQPGEGRASKGGLKFSEMESNAALEHTAAEFIKDRLGVDQIKVKICNCGYIWDFEKEGLMCNICGKESSTTTVSLPYAFVILTKILKAGHISTKFNVKKEQTQETETEKTVDLDELNVDYLEELETDNIEE